MKIWKGSNHLPKNRLLDFNMERMEKLIELLNEYDSSNGREETDKGIDNIWKIYEFHSELQIISKKYGFIKRLVDSDKIDKACLFFNTADLPDDNVSKLLMLLAISDNPIKDLISYLK